MKFAFEQIQRGSGSPSAAMSAKPMRQRAKPGLVGKALGKLVHRAFSALVEDAAPAPRELPPEYFRFPPF